MNRSLLSLLDGLSNTDGLDDITVSGLAEQSQEVHAGDLYLAVRGCQVHGLDFLSEAVERGARAVIYEPDQDRNAALKPATVTDIPLIPVPDLRHKVGIIADRFFDHPSSAMQVIAITGTNGKSSTASIIAQVLSQKYGSCGMFGTLGYGEFKHLQSAVTTTPAALELHTRVSDLYAQGVRHIAMEASSHGLDQGRLAGLSINVAVLTMVGRDHFDYHGSLEAYWKAKRKLFEFSDLQWAVLNLDDAYGKTLAKECAADVEILTYSSQGNPKADLSAHNIKVGVQGLYFKLVYQGRTTVVRSRLLGRFNVDSLLAAFAVLLIQGLSEEEIAALLADVDTVPGRMQMFSRPGQPYVIVDYAHTPDALEKVLRTCREMGSGKLYCVFGCGGNRDKEKRPLMGAVASHLSDRIILTDDNPRDEDPEQIIQDILSGVVSQTDIEIEHDREIAVKHAIHRSQVSDYVLIAGKGNESFQIVRDKRIPMSDQHFVNKAFENRPHAMA